MFLLSKSFLATQMRLMLIGIIMFFSTAYGQDAAPQNADQAVPFSDAGKNNSVPLPNPSLIDNYPVPRPQPPADNPKVHKKLLDAISKVNARKELLDFDTIKHAFNAHFSTDLEQSSTPGILDFATSYVLDSEAKITYQISIKTLADIDSKFPQFVTLWINPLHECLKLKEIAKVLGETRWPEPVLNPGPNGTSVTFRIIDSASGFKIRRTVGLDGRGCVDLIAFFEQRK